MLRRRLVLLGCALLTSGCLWPVRENTDATVSELAARALDPQQQPVMPPAVAGGKRVGPADVKAASFPTADAQTTALMQGQVPPPTERLKIPLNVPGSDAAKLIDLTGLTEKQKETKVAELYPDLPPVDEAPRPQPGPGGKPYTLADLQRIASENSPALRQAAADVEAARGALIQAKTYTNPTFSYLQDPTNNNSDGGVAGMAIEQVIRTFGKQKLGVAAAQRDLRTAELALRRARIDLATAVRTAYYGFLVADEVMMVTRAMASFTDEVYHFQKRLALRAGMFAVYEPAPLRAQAYSVRLAYKQAVQSYAYAWKQLVAALGLHQLPLTEIAGRIDRYVPRFEFDTVREQMLSRHTDVLLARNGIEKARYVLKLAQITPYPDLDIRYSVEHDTFLAPYGWYHSVSIGAPLPIWDRNKGNIISAQAALERALEQPHTAEVTLTGNLSTAFTAYQTNLAALIYYRRHVLPDLVRYYVGVFTRRQVDAMANFNDLVTAQQAVVSNVQTYLSTLGSFWTGAVQVAALLQTEDLFQLGKPEELPEMPDLKGLLKELPRWACHHGTTAPPVSPILPGGHAPCPPVGMAGKLPAPPPEVLPAPQQLPPAPLPLPTVLPDVIPSEVRPSSEAPRR